MRWCQKCVPATGTTLRLLNLDWEQTGRAVEFHKPRGSNAGAGVPVLRQIWINHVAAQALIAICWFAAGIGGSVSLGKSYVVGGSKEWLLFIGSVGCLVVGIVEGWIHEPI